MTGVDIFLYVACALVMRIGYKPIAEECVATPGSNYLGNHAFELRQLFQNSKLKADAFFALNTIVTELTKGRYILELGWDEDFKKNAVASTYKERGPTGYIVAVDTTHEDHPLKTWAHMLSKDRFYYIISTDSAHPILFQGRKRPRLNIR